MSSISITKSAGTWVVRAFGSVIGESHSALVLAEDGMDEVIYFPREDIGMEFLERSDKTSTCPKKGVASYFGISTTEGLKRDAAWSYEDPLEAAARIKNHIAFYTDKVTVEEL